MQFYRKKARSMGVPIVPMIDILTILLIFFIVHTQWKKPQSLLKSGIHGRDSVFGTAGRFGRDGDIRHFPEWQAGGDE